MTTYATEGRKCPRHACEFILAHPDMPPMDLAAALHVKIQSARRYRHLLIQEGAIPPLHPRIDMDHARLMIEDGSSIKDAARALGIPTNSLILRFHRRYGGVDILRDDVVYSAREFARILGWTHTRTTKALTRWRGAGMIEAKKRPGQRLNWRIPATALTAFLDREDCPLSPADIADPSWREYRQDVLNRRHLWTKGTR
jgi:hypothetical protein